MNKYLSKFWIAPVITLTVLAISYCIYFLFFPDNANEYTKDFGIIDNTGYFLYAVLLLLFGLYRKDFIPSHKKTHMVLVTLTIMAVLREAGAQKWVPTQDTTMLKIRFFTNPNNPFSEKIIAAIVVALLIGLVVYILALYLKPIMKGFFNKNPLSWTIVTFCTAGATSKIIDRLPANLRKFGFEVLESHRNLMLVFEETGELLLPVLGIVALSQFHAANTK